MLPVFRLYAVGLACRFRQLLTVLLGSCPCLHGLRSADCFPDQDCPFTVHRCNPSNYRGLRVQQLPLSTHYRSGWAVCSVGSGRFDANAVRAVKSRQQPPQPTVHSLSIPSSRLRCSSCHSHCVIPGVKSFLVSLFARFF
jgi:hypothetical protein